MKTFRHFVAERTRLQQEDGAGGGAGGGAGAGAGVAVNNAGSGNIAGLGVNKDGKPANWGEPGVNLKKRKQTEALSDTGPKLKLAHPEPDYSTKTQDELDIWLKHGGQPTQKHWEKGAKGVKKEGQSDFDYSNDIIAELVSEGVAVAPVDKFAGASVFEVDMDKVHKSRFGKNRYHRYSRYVGEDEVGEAIRVHGRSTKNDIILKDSKTAVMTYLRRKAPIG
jgi:hypothetical protein